MLLSPLDPDKELSIYQCYDRKRKLYFCPKCGVRCLSFGGVGETVVVDFTQLELDGVGDANREGLNGKREVWRAKWGGQNDASRPYVSVNGTSIDYIEGGGFDMRVLTEEKRVQYFDDLSEPAEKKMEARWERPHYGGCY